MQFKKIYYLMGLEIKIKQIKQNVGINEYLGELYVYTKDIILQLKD